MTALSPSVPVGVIGAGTMGHGIAQVAAAAGHTVYLYDAQEGAAEAGKAKVAKALERVVSKGRITAEDRDALLARITPCTRLDELKGAGLAVEAVTENLTVKHEVFLALEELLGPDALLASNTSSISLTSIGAPLAHPERLVGMHFFNPAPVMALVEIVHGLATSEATAAAVYDTAEAWGKVPVHARSTPGFIVNRVARPFYGEAYRTLEEQAADHATVDAVLKQAGGFRMGPFELMDLVGLDVNFAVTQSVYNAFFQDPRYKPSLVQQEMVASGRLGRKSGQGFYDYGEGAAPPAPATLPPQPAPQEVVLLGDLGPAAALAARLEQAGVAHTHEPATHGRLHVGPATLVLTDGRSATARAAAEGVDDLIVFDLALDYTTASRIALAPADQASSEAMHAAAGLFQALGLAVSVLPDHPGLIVMRTVAMLVNEAASAVETGVAAPAGVDTAMLRGVSYPVGPFAWGERLGLAKVLGVLDHLADHYREDRYRASALLRRRVQGGTRFLA